MHDTWPLEVPLPSTWDTGSLLNDIHDLPVDLPWRNHAHVSQLGLATLYRDVTNGDQ